MKIICQIGVIFAVCWAGQIIEALLPFSFPASVISMVLLFVLLATGGLKLDHIREKSDFLLANMSFFFLPAGVSMLNYFDVLKSTWVQLLVICLVTMVLVFAATALSVRFTLYLLERRKRHE
ncbi:CidA/LrgA family protein [Flavonifractor sp. DFI.6.63]|uniref:CidA/LrgA family protein n=1 Tax=Lawsonibacter hominis TaxID=2763053 RepID=A0A8J6J5D2_9FIRM|nr:MULTISPECIES: CidA/LrgA family protein [Oscillospiraceae]MBC5734083.1 CidA/LrgA family protein [Lawsonibacter hominis]MCQ5030250.1 CidA/LrgA family protein [Flavonifractor sp. DFI.6.63]MDU2195291.1 CidA/LrgA family protein [Clostridiales bacterium]